MENNKELKAKKVWVKPEFHEENIEITLGKIANRIETGAFRS